MKINDLITDIHQNAVNHGWWEGTRRSLAEIIALIHSEWSEALEKQIRLQTPITAKQAQFLNDAIRAKARELLDKRGLADNKKAVTRLGNCIRKDVLARYGIAGLREIPRHEYQVAMSQISMWSNALTLRDIAREAREYVQVVEVAGQSAGVDGAQAVSGADHQLGE